MSRVRAVDDHPVLDVVCLGEMLIDLTPSDSWTGDRWVFQANPGGAPANVAVGLSRLGLRAGFLGAISRDAFGERLYQTLTSERVDVRFVKRCEEPTTLAVVTLDDQGDRSFSFYRERTSDLSLSVDDVPDVLFNSTRALHVCSVSLSGSPAREATIDAVRRARHSGVFISFDVNLRESLWRGLAEARSLIWEILPYADFVKLSEAELEFVVGSDVPGSLLKFEKDRNRPTLWVITRGERPCSYLFGDKKGDVPAYTVRAVDTTGAGDAFVAGVLSKLSGAGFEIGGEEELVEAVCFGHAAAAFSVGRRGAIPSLPTPSDIRVFKNERG